MEVQLDRLCARSEGRRCTNANALLDGDRHGPRRMCDRDHEYRSVRKDDGSRIPRRGTSRSICDRSRRKIGSFRLTMHGARGAWATRQMTMARPKSAGGQQLTCDSRAYQDFGASAHRRVARCGALEIYESFANAPIKQREYGALRVGAMDDP